MIDLNGQEEALALESCKEVIFGNGSKISFTKIDPKDRFVGVKQEDHSHYGEQEEQDFGSYDPEPHSGTWGEL